MLWLFASWYVYSGAEFDCADRTGDIDVDLVPMEDWAHKEREMAAIFADFLKRAQAKAA